MTVTDAPAATARWEAFAVCRTRPYDWWETGDGGNRLAMTLCRLACPVREECAGADPSPVGVVRAGVAYSMTGAALPECPCGRPVTARGHRPGWCTTCEPIAVCGFIQAYDRHIDRGETPCRPCREARRAHSVEVRRIRAARRLAQREAEAAVAA